MARIPHWIRRLPVFRQMVELRRLRRDVAALRQQREVRGFPAGHYYSPIPDVKAVLSDAPRIYAPPSPELPGLDMRPAHQLAVLERFARFYPEQPFSDQQRSGVRYYFDNTFYCYGDALTLYSMLRDLRPRRLVEVGSGFSSAVALDTNDLFLQREVRCTFIEPYPKRLLSLLRPQDRAHVTLIQDRVQDVALGVFEELDAGDILLIDSSHVSKVDSDVNFLFFNVLPRLRAGVYVHVHDVMYPFEYPVAWIEEGRAWNEAYLLRAFLMFNEVFQIHLFNSYLARFHSSFLADKLPLWLKNPGGSVWLCKSR